MYTEGKMSADLLTRSGVRRLIGATANIYREALDAPTIGYEIPPSMRKKLEEDIFVFSGFKTYHQLKEASMLLRDDAGNLKPFGQFYRDVAQIREKYNRNWLRAEYNFATASAEMAAQWAAYAREKAYTNLQYRTALDDKVRPEHAALEGITLPQDDPFWNTAFPPNGWNCRCNVVPVLKEDYPVSNSEAAQLSFRQLTEGDAEMFRFNPGKESVLFPPHHPYYGRQGYRHCATQRLAANDDKHDLGDPCRVYHKLHEPEELVLEKEIRELMEKEGRSLKAATRSAYFKTLREDFYPTKLYKELQLPTGDIKKVRITFRKKGINHIVNDVLEGRCPSLSMDDLLYLDEYITEGKQMNKSGELYKSRDDDLEYFYYLNTTIGDSSVVIELAVKNERKEIYVFPYSIYERKKS